MTNPIIVKIDKDLEDLIPTYLQRRSEEIEKIHEAINGNDFNSLKVIGHKLSGNAGGYGFDDLGVYGASIEHAAEKENMDTIKENFEKIKDYLNRIQVTYV